MKNLFLKLAILIACFLNAAIIYSTPINQYISSVTPTQNAVSVNKSSNITIVFTQDMNPATINNANIMVFGYQTGLLPVTIDYNQVNKTANINPNQELKAGEKVSVTLTSGIRTISNSNISPFVYTFYVQAIGGNGIFTSTSSIDNVLNAVIKSGDIDMDGDIDLIVNNRIYLNNGNAGFIFSNELSVSGIPELADFDNDGDIDIAIGDYSGNSVGILLNGDIPLPVELTSFTSETETNNVTLNWTTSSEENNAGYDVERSMFNVQTSMFND
ncbi:MAG TPA: Ig-like domain-containing protein, partial [Ignavibacteria bacterium]|nr:Ig-like domain-containing protein [Ignavibacteria bacterium]